MNKTTKKLFVSSLALAFAAATTISTSYAWFTMQTTAKVTQLDVKLLQVPVLKLNLVELQMLKTMVKLLLLQNLIKHILVD
jgi:hypothetical protein